MLLALVGVGASGWLGKPWPERSVVEGMAQLRVEMPSVISTGDLYETRIHVHARSDITRLQIEVDRALWSESTINSMLPAASKEQFSNGRFRFEFDALDQGEEMVFKVDAQVNPRFFGLLTGEIRVLDDGRELVASQRRMRVMP